MNEKHRGCRGPSHYLLGFHDGHAEVVRQKSGDDVLHLIHPILLETLQALTGRVGLAAYGLHHFLPFVKAHAWRVLDDSLGQGRAEGTGILSSSAPQSSARRMIIKQERRTSAACS